MARLFSSSPAFAHSKQHAAALAGAGARRAPRRVRAGSTLRSFPVKFKTHNFSNRGPQIPESLLTCPKNALSKFEVPTGWAHSSRLPYELRSYYGLSRMRASGAETHGTASAR